LPICDRCGNDFSADDIYMMLAINQKLGEVYYVENACSKCLELERFHLEN